MISTMEKKQKLMCSKLNNRSILFITVMIMLHGISHGYPNPQKGQAARLRAIWKAKIRAGLNGRFGDNQWRVPSLSSELHVSSDAGSGKMEDDLIVGGLPGQPSGVMFKQYAGYVNVDEGKGRSLFYYFVEAAQNSSSKPLVLWLNGGPGCSSLGVGALEEIGPFGVNPDGKTLYSRPYAWNKVVNVLFLESPAGVGFSYSNTSSDYNVGDKRTAQDAYTFLINWFKRYPRHKTMDFYIAGESYAGFYIPELADTIIQRNKEADPSLIIQLKGIMVGNGIMNIETDSRGQFDYIWSHALISDETYRGVMEHCLNKFNGLKCFHFEERQYEEIGEINRYDIYGPLCLESSNSSRKMERLGGYDPCERDYVRTYLNLPQVQEALHANRTKLPYEWDTCSIVIQWEDSPSTMFPIYRRLISSRLRILLYSGDVDAVVPVTSTRYSINALNLKVLKAWHPWSDVTEEVGGYKVVYNGLTFATVRGAGHEVPQHKPSRAFTLFKTYIAGNE